MRQQQTSLFIQVSLLKGSFNVISQEVSTLVHLIYICSISITRSTCFLLIMAFCSKKCWWIRYMTYCNCKSLYMALIWGNYETKIVKTVLFSSFNRGWFVQLTCSSTIFINTFYHQPTYWTTKSRRQMKINHIILFPPVIFTHSHE